MNNHKAYSMSVIAPFYNLAERLGAWADEPAIHLKASKMFRRLRMFSRPGIKLRPYSGIPTKARHARRWKKHYRDLVKAINLNF